MRYDLEEVIIEFDSNNILKLMIKEDVTELTIEPAIEAISIMNKALSSNDEPKGVFVMMPSFYIKKDVLKTYNDNDLNFDVAAIVSNSFTSKLIGDVAIKVHKRIQLAKKEEIKPTKMFGDQEAAYQWLLEELDKLK